MNRYLCIHGHFYQPPRENPWLEKIELQSSARPYHDWNERITAECYAPNGDSRILDLAQKIERIVNNYSRISFNFGPTLLSWMQREAPEAYQRILEADSESQELYHGHGSAMAQAYNHMIMPLANRRDKETQILWGKSDFRARFGRDPEGMWLPETACDLESLELMAKHGIRFTLLSPHQAGRVRRTGESHWQDVRGGQVDPSQAYTQSLPGGGSIAVFFYDGPVSQAVAFQNLLSDGKGFAHRLLEGFAEQRNRPQLMHIATDGESYGHHHRFGDMALAYALDYIERNQLAQLTNYGAYLERHPPTHEVEILENSSWSCDHGVERWRSHCGCNTGSHPDWNQEWRRPLRESLDWLRDRLAAVYEMEGEDQFKDPWQARNEYIQVVLDRSEDHVNAFLTRHSRSERSEEGDRRALRLLEMQRHAMLMYTSCGWFFDDLSGIETVQVIQYAGRAIQLAEALQAETVEEPFLMLLEKAQSNLTLQGNGRQVYEAAVKPAIINPVRAGSHFAVSTLFEEYPETATIHCYEVHQEAKAVLDSGLTRLSLGRARIRSLITRASAPIEYAVLHLGDHNISGGARESLGRESYEEMESAVQSAFQRMDITELIGLFRTYFGSSTFSLRTLFHDEQRKYLDRVLSDALANAEAAYVQVYQTHAPVMKFLTGLGFPLPAAFRVAADFALGHLLLKALESDELNVAEIRKLLRETRERGIELKGETLAYAYRKKLDRLAEAWRRSPLDSRCLERLIAAVALIEYFPFEVNLWSAQNVFHEVQGAQWAGTEARARAGEAEAARWLERLRALGILLWMKV